MRGIEALQAMRMQRQVPSVGVLISLSYKVPPYLDLALDRSLEAGIVTLEVDPTEDFCKLDLRALLGLRVGVVDWIDDPEALCALCVACLDAGAAFVVGMDYHGLGDIRRSFTLGSDPWQQ